ncbi:MAG: helix-hairpin-helix domain-containing protein, partial [Promethearchaeota archaeon]
MLNFLNSEKLEGVKATENFIGNTTYDIFQKDILSVYNQKITKIRPVIGPNGAGKTTLLKFKVKDAINEITPYYNLSLFFDFKQITDKIDEFWPIFMQNLVSQLIEEETQILPSLLEKMDSLKRDIELMNIFKNPVLIDNLIKLTSSSSRERRSALSYFYDMELDTKTISDLFYGILKLALELDYFVSVAFDELQFLDEIDESNRLLKIFSEKFIRYLMEQFSNERLYIVISCLENPTDKEWTKLKSHSRSFESIVKEKEIILGNLTTEEKNQIIKQIAKKIGFDRKNRKIFFTKVKGSLYYYLPRDLLKQVANVLDTMDFVGYTQYEIRQIYEDDARTYMKDILRSKGFVYLEPEVKKIGDYNIDIFATGPTRRSGYLTKAFGEATITKRASIKQKAEKFSNWLLRMKGREYNPDKGDFAFFVCPPDSATEGTIEVLNANNIELYNFNSPLTDQINYQRKKAEEEESEISEIIETKEEEKIEEEKPIFIKESRYNLEDIPGIGPAYAKKLQESGIHTIKDLLNCSTKIKAME